MVLGLYLSLRMCDVHEFLDDHRLGMLVGTAFLMCCRSATYRNPWPRFLFQYPRLRRDSGACPCRQGMCISARRKSLQRGDAVGLITHNQPRRSCPCVFAVRRWMTPVPSRLFSSCDLAINIRAKHTCHCLNPSSQRPNGNDLPHHLVRHILGLVSVVDIEDNLVVVSHVLP